MTDNLPATHDPDQSVYEWANVVPRDSDGFAGTLSTPPGVTESFWRGDYDRDGALVRAAGPHPARDVPVWRLRRHGGDRAVGRGGS